MKKAALTHQAQPEPPATTLPATQARAAHHVSLRQLGDGRWRVAYTSRTGREHVRCRCPDETYARIFAAALSRLLDAPMVES